MGNTYMGVRYMKSSASCTFKMCISPHVRHMNKTYLKFKNYDIIRKKFLIIYFIKCW